LSDPADDVLGLEVVDSLGQWIGHVEELLMDVRECRVRLLRVRSMGRQGRAGVTRLIPVDAVWQITEREVSVNRAQAHVEAGPADVAAEPEQRELEHIYAHYGYYPYWAPGYVYPSYPVYS
jgi:sporulation protein YlmC with PRC-barrel domain